jgi:peptide/nickel transport system substrate-binding protein
MSDKPTENSPLKREISRRDLLVKAGTLGAGALAAGSLTGNAGAAIERVARRSAKKVPTGGTISWALQADPGEIAPFGGISTTVQQSNEIMYDSLLQWDPHLNIRTALATYEVISPTEIHWTIVPGRKFSNGQPVTAADLQYSFGLQSTDPPPGSISALGQFPYIDVANSGPISTYKYKMALSHPDARVFGYLAWTRYSAIVPDGMYTSLNPAVSGIGTGPFMLNGSYQPGVGINYVKNPNFWQPGLPYLDGINYEFITQDSTAIAALISGDLDGYTFASNANALTLIGHPGVTVLHNLTAAFRELQMTIQTGNGPKPWWDQRVREAVSLAINRQNIINDVYAGYGQLTGHVAAGYGPWPLTTAQLATYETQNVAKAKSLMAAAGYASGFSVTMTTSASPSDYVSMAQLIAADLAAIGITVNIVPQVSATFAANNGAGTFDWDLTGRGMRGDVDGYVAEFNPADLTYGIWFSGYKNTEMWRLVGDGRIQLNEAKRLPIYHDLGNLLMTQLIEIPIVSTESFIAVNDNLKNMYVSFTGSNPGLRYVYLES